MVQPTLPLVAENSSSSTAPQLTRAKPPKPKKSSSLFQLFLEVTFVVVVLEYVNYRVLSPKLPNHREIEQFHETHMAWQTNHNHSSSNGGPKPKKKKKAKPKPQHVPLVLEETGDEDHADDRRRTGQRLQHMGVSATTVRLGDLPPWSQILDNYNGAADGTPNDENDDEPVILGLDQCPQIRESIPSTKVGMAATGLYRTGTGLLTELLKRNCVGPNQRAGASDGFVLDYAPWGTWNPAHDRYRLEKEYTKVEVDQKHIVPIVVIQHPYVWMNNLCDKPDKYRIKLQRKKSECHETSGLKHKVKQVTYGFEGNWKNNHQPETQKDPYDSLAHMWKEWYAPYFLDEPQEQPQQQTPRIMVRHEDLVFRPKKVVRQVCECFGGTNKNIIKDWDHPNGFRYEEESKIRDGTVRQGTTSSGLLSAVVKYGQSLRSVYSRYNQSDRQVMKTVFQGETDPKLRSLFRTFRYRLFDDVEEPTEDEKNQARKDLEVYQAIQAEEAKRLLERKKAGFRKTTVLETH